jgi:hypothetical protein
MTRPYTPEKGDRFIAYHKKKRDYYHRCSPFICQGEINNKIVGADAEGEEFYLNAIDWDFVKCNAQSVIGNIRPSKKVSSETKS